MNVERTSGQELSEHAEQYLASISERQRAVLELMAEGRSNPQIAEDLGISLDGAKQRVSEVLTRLGFTSREQAAAWWRERNGFTGVPRRMRRRAPMLIAAAGAIGAFGIGIAILAAFLGEGDEPGGAYGPLTPGMWVATILDPSTQELPVTKNRIRLFNPATGEARLLGKPEELYRGVFLSADGMHVLAIISSGSGPTLSSRLRILPVDGSRARDVQTQDLGPAPAAIPAGERSPDGRYVAWRVPELFIVEIATGRLVADYRGSIGPQETANGYGWSDDSRWFTTWVDTGTPGEQGIMVFGVDGSTYDLNAASAESQVIAADLPLDLQVFRDELAGRVPEATVFGPPGSLRRTADGSGVLAVVLNRATDAREVIVRSNGVETRLDELSRAVPYSLEPGWFDVIVVP